MIPSFIRQLWILFGGEVLLIFLSCQFSAILRLDTLYNVLDIQTGATIFTVIVYLAMLYVFDLYNMGRDLASWDTVIRICVSAGFAGIICASLFYSLPNWSYGRGIFLIQMLLVCGFLILWRWVLSLIFSKTSVKENVLILGAGRSGKALYHLLKDWRAPCNVVGFLDDDWAKQGKVMGSPSVLGTIEQLPQIAAEKHAKTAILAITRNRPNHLIRRLMELRFQGFAIFDMPTVCECLVGRIPVRYVQEEGLLFAEGFFLLSKEYLRKVKRLIDLGVSTLLIFTTIPITVLAAIAIRLDSPGPIFFRQSRVGAGGKVFKVCKFRSMVQNAEQNGAVWAKKKDPRVTRIGRWMRLLRIDEIPQLINVFRGEMSLIGPRPERPEFVRELETKIPFYSLRHSVRPGVTGWAQVNYRYGASVEDALIKLEYDIYYVKNMSILLDIKILLKTIGVVLFGQGAQ